MKKALPALCLCLFACAFPAFAEDHPKFDLYGGWSLLHYGAVQSVQGNDLSYTSYKGFGLSGCVYLTPSIGIVGDFSWNQKNKEVYYNILTWDAKGTAMFALFGPQFAMRSHESVTPFVRALLGLSHVKIDLGEYELFTENKFAFGFGAGLDVKVSDHVSVRVGQVDYIRVTSGYAKGNVFRFGAGIVFNAR